ncbi:hypothetical protein GGI24_006951 [Coemansia furcata]|nr:hypothetical protein GGI24_006951 [Coemansia furcata]
MDDCPLKGQERVERAVDTGSAANDQHISSSSKVDDFAEGFASDDDSESSEGDDEVSIFVAEEAYAPLDDADEDGLNMVVGAASANIDDAFQCRDATNPAATVATPAAPSFDKQMPFDFEQELDDRIEAGLAAKESKAADVVSNQAPCDASGITPNLTPIEVVVGRSDKMSDEHIDQIKSIMAGIQLSDAAIPEWSRRVPEGSWMPRRRTVSSVYRPVVPDPRKADGSPIDSLASDLQSNH